MSDEQQPTTGRRPWRIKNDHLYDDEKQLVPSAGIIVTGFRTMLVAVGAGILAGAGLYYTHRLTDLVAGVTDPLRPAGTVDGGRRCRTASRVGGSGSGSVLVAVEPVMLMTLGSWERGSAGRSPANRQARGVRRKLRPGNTQLTQGLYDAQRPARPCWRSPRTSPPATSAGTGYLQETHPERLFTECSDYCEMIGPSLKAGLRGPPPRWIRLAPGRLDRRRRRRFGHGRRGGLRGDPHRSTGSWGPPCGSSV